MVAQMMIYKTKFAQGVGFTHFAANFFTNFQRVSQITAGGVIVAQVTVNDAQIAQSLGRTLPVTNLSLNIQGLFKIISRGFIVALIQINQANIVKRFRLTPAMADEPAVVALLPGTKVVR